MRTSYHSVHEPTCGICGKHSRSFESMREHLIGNFSIHLTRFCGCLISEFNLHCDVSHFFVYSGPLPKAECERIFKDRGCDICLAIFGSRNALRVHRETCQLSRGNAVYINTHSQKKKKNNSLLFQIDSDQFADYNKYLNNDVLSGAISSHGEPWHL